MPQCTYCQCDVEESNVCVVCSELSEIFNKDKCEYSDYMEKLTSGYIFLFDSTIESLVDTKKRTTVLMPFDKDFYEAAKPPVDSNPKDAEIYWYCLAAVCILRKYELKDSTQKGFEEYCNQVTDFIKTNTACGDNHPYLVMIQKAQANELARIIKAEEKRIEEQRRLEEEKQAEEQRRLEEEKQAEEQRRLEEEKRVEAVLQNSSAEKKAKGAQIKKDKADAKKLNAPRLKLEKEVEDIKKQLAEEEKREHDKLIKLMKANLNKIKSDQQKSREAQRAQRELQTLQETREAIIARGQAALKKEKLSNLCQTMYILQHPGEYKLSATKKMPTLEELRREIKDRLMGDSAKLTTDIEHLLGVCPNLGTLDSFKNIISDIFNHFTEEEKGVAKQNKEMLIKKVDEKANEMKLAATQAASPQEDQKNETDEALTPNTLKNMALGDLCGYKYSWDHPDESKANKDRMPPLPEINKEIKVRILANTKKFTLEVNEFLKICPNVAILYSFKNSLLQIFDSLTKAEQLEAERNKKILLEKCDECLLTLPGQTEHKKDMQKFLETTGDDMLTKMLACGTLTQLEGFLKRIQSQKMHDKSGVLARDEQTVIRRINELRDRASVSAATTGVATFTSPPAAATGNPQLGAKKIVLNPDECKDQLKIVLTKLKNLKNQDSSSEFRKKSAAFAQPRIEVINLLLRGSVPSDEQMTLLTSAFDTIINKLKDPQFVPEAELNKEAALQLKEYNQRKSQALDSPQSTQSASQKM